MAATDVFDFATATSAGAETTPWGVDNPNACPVCGQPDVQDYQSTEFAGGGLVWQGAYCDQCGAKWSEDYHLLTACVQNETRPSEPNEMVVAAGSILDAALDVLTVHDGGGAEIKALLDSCQAMLGVHGLFRELDRRAKRSVGVA